MATKSIGSFQQFWPYYVREHHLPLTRWVHFLGTTLALGLAVAALIWRQPLWLLLVPVCGYAFAWGSHVLVEHNRPATFTYPRWSLLGDFKMWWLMVRGRMPAEIRRLQAEGLL